MNKQMLAFLVMTAVQQSYASSGKSDSDFAKQLSDELEQNISTARVRQARAALDIKNNVLSVASIKEAIGIIQKLIPLVDPDNAETLEVLNEAKEFVK